MYGDDARKCQPGCKYPKTDTKPPGENITPRHRLLHVIDRNSKLKFLVDTGSEVSLIPLSYAARLKDHFRSMRPILTRQNDRTEQIHKDLSTCPFVFVRVDAARKPSQPPYDGPFKIEAGLDVNPTSALPIPSLVVPPDNVHSSNTRAQYSSKDTVQPPTSPIQSSPPR
ncbi:unnamed protein product [Hymenolepis diminuta]|uniref:Peptidase A2 domain-containing protein n=1 Tax=Hymenolepis diminuta TaxID=6216 RepID=A0A564Y1B4_HYMDI|nr:unnamed protein product [Hymenolepis diminuta]